MNRIRSLALMASLALAALPALAQMPAPAAPASQAAAVVPPGQRATPEQIRKFFEVARIRQQMQMAMGMMPRIVVQAYQTELDNLSKQLPAGRQLTQQERASLDNIMQSYMQKASTLYTVDQMIDDAIPVYQRHISRIDADAIIAFYSSPAGRHILDAQPIIMREYMPIEISHVMQASKKLTTQMTQDMENAVRSSQTQPVPPSSTPQ